MAIYCSHCGTLLPKEDARFCNHCGTLVPARSQRPQASSQSQETAVPLAQGRQEEQTAGVDRKEIPLVEGERTLLQQSNILRKDAQPSPTPRKEQSVSLEKKVPSISESVGQQENGKEEKPAPRSSRMQRSERQGAKLKTPRGSVPLGTVAWPSPLNHVVIKESAAPGKASPAKSGVPAFPTVLPEPRLPAPTSPANVRTRETQADEEQLPDEEKRRIEDVPTRVLTADPQRGSRAAEEISASVVEAVTQSETPATDGAEGRISGEKAEAESRKQTSTDGRKVELATVEKAEVEAPEAVQGLFVSKEERETVEELSLPREEREAVTSAQADGAKGEAQRGPVVERNIRPAVPPTPFLGIEPSVRESLPSASSAVQPREHAASLISKLGKRNRLPLLGAAVVSLLLLGVLVAWLVLAQPFAVSPIIEPQQSFKDSALGISLLFPTGWQEQRDRSQKSISFHDSSSTAQVNIAVSEQHPSDLAQYLQQQAAQRGMTTLKQRPPIVFGGATWQQLQGSMQQNGATYTTTLLVAPHGNRLFTISLIAHQSIYSDEENVTFAPMRSSFKFIDT